MEFQGTAVCYVNYLKDRFVSPCRSLLFCLKKKLNREIFVSRCIKEKLQACRTPETVTVRNKGFWIVVQHGSQVSGCNAFSFNYPKITSYVANFSCTFSFNWHRIEVGISQYSGGGGGGYAYNEGYCFCQECTWEHLHWSRTIHTKDAILLFCYEIYNNNNQFVSVFCNLIFYVIAI
jgi:hypothetical protein